ncbi:MAG: hypothetical protein KDA59_12965 [Planctomycetales bacterium]|nr:hypothetical protein [Planctomycetales bacterium]
MKPFDEELISAYIDNELSEDERREVERWLAESAEHRRLYEELASIHQRLSELPRHQLHGDYVEPVVREIRENPMLAPAAPLRTTWPPNPATVETPVFAMKEAPANRRPSWRSWTVVGVVAAAAATVLVVLSLPDTRQGDLAQSDSTAENEARSSEALIAESPEPETPTAATPMAEEASGASLERAESRSADEAVTPSAMSSPAEPPGAMMMRQNAASAEMPASSEMPADAFSASRGGTWGRGGFGGGLATPAEKSAAGNSPAFGVGDQPPRSFPAPASSAADAKPTSAPMNEFTRGASEAEATAAGQAGSPGARALRAEPSPIGAMGAAVGRAAGEPLPSVAGPIESQNRLADRPRSASLPRGAGLPAADVVVFVTIAPDQLAEMLRERKLQEFEASPSLASNQFGRDPSTAKSIGGSRDDQRTRRQAADLVTSPDAADSSRSKPATSSATKRIEPEEAAVFDEAVYVAADAEMLARLVRQIEERPASRLTIEPVNESADAVRFSQSLAKQRMEPAASPADKPVKDEAAPELRQPQRNARKADDDAVPAIDKAADAPVAKESLKEKSIAAEKKQDPAPVAGAATSPSAEESAVRPAVRYYFQHSAPSEAVAGENDRASAEDASATVSAPKALSDEARPLRVLFLLRSPDAPPVPQ